MKITRPQWTLIAAACLIVAASAAQSDADRPPGVEENRWIPISDTAGIALTSSSALPASVRLRQSDAAVPQVLRSGTGILMVKSGGAWMRVDLDLPQPRVHPAL
jgi:hypothetical protein